MPKANLDNAWIMNTLVTTTSTHLPLAETTHPIFLGTTLVLDVKHILRNDGFMLIVFLPYCENNQVNYTTISWILMQVQMYLYRIWHKCKRKKLIRMTFMHVCIRKHWSLSIIYVCSILSQLMHIRKTWLHPTY